MRKMITLVILAAVLVGIGYSLASKKEQARTSSQGHTLSKTFSSLDEMARDSNVIIKGRISEEFRVQSMGKIVFYVYDILVEKLYRNQTAQEITEGKTLEIHRLVGVNWGEGNDMVNIVAPEYQTLQRGEYLLFLNGDYDEGLKKHILIPNTPNQLFKVEQSNASPHLQSRNPTFINITDSDALPSITEAELLEVIHTSGFAK
ncbi:hypothetical protein [uncultured Brevibacillus sp.]|uniref:hypothetical protein n=1 Tax=uncultured Brevibacillus sp. TaxID=169970 RepID=UPI0025926199|nr:hypothetical protein [uncultured Brevibacillus sp.]